MVTPGAAEVIPPGAQAQHTQAAPKHENVLGSGLTHRTQEKNTEALDLAISVVMMMIAALLH